MVLSGQLMCWSGVGLGGDKSAVESYQSRVFAGRDVKMWLVRLLSNTCVVNTRPGTKVTHQ